LEGYEGITDF
jgi:hypothetical protein